MDSSEESLGLEDIAGNGFGGVVELEERIMSGNCGTEDRRVVVVEDYRTGGRLNLGDTSYMKFCFDTIVDKRCMNKSLTVYPVLTLQSGSCLLCKHEMIDMSIERVRQRTIQPEILKTQKKKHSIHP